MEEILTHKDIFDSTSNGVIATDAKGIVTLINQQAAKILTVKIRDAKGVKITETFPEAGKFVTKCLKTGKSQLNRHIHEGQADLVLNTTPIKKSNKIIGTVSNFQEMRLFEALARQLESYVQLNERLNTIFNSSSDGIWVYDGDGKVITVNEACKKNDGISAKDVAGKHFSDLIREGFYDRSVVPDILKTKRKISIYSTSSRTGKKLMVTGTPSFNERGEISLIVVNVHDMTQLNELRKKLEETRTITEKYKDELTELSMLMENEEIITKDDSYRQTLQLCLKLARMETSNILLTGESGTGKGLLAKFIHKNSNRSKKSFIQINCASVPANLLEAELFGYEKGAFTGAGDQGKAGLIELAHEGTLFLDEIGDLPLQLQAKLLKYFDDNEVRRVGSTSVRKLDCLVIAATNKDLRELLRKERFREDLYFRLHTFPIHITPLRERSQDIFELSYHFLEKYNKAYKQNKRITTEGFKVLLSHPFPGNVRELKNLLKQAVVMIEKNTLDQAALESLLGISNQQAGSKQSRKISNGLKEHVEKLEKQILKDAMRKYRTTRKTANALKTSHSTIVRKLNKYRITR